MNRYIYLFFILFSVEAFAVAKVTLKFVDSKIKQGSVVEAVIGLNSETTQKLQYNQLKGQTLADAFYIFQAKPLMTKGSWDTLESEAKIIVTKIPENRPLIHKLGNDTIEVHWNDVEFIPTEVPQTYLFGQFEVPTRIELMKWISGLVFLLVASLFGFKFYNRIKASRELKSKRRALKDSLSNPASYDDVVAVWKNKSSYTKEFPHLDEHFKNLEKVLFKYQFKPSQSELEKAEVLRAYRDFLANSQGGFNGI